MPNLKNGIIYKLICKDKKINQIYIGSTINLINRISLHKRDCLTKNTKLYKCIRNNGGFKNWEFKKIANIVSENNKDIRKLERFYFEHYKPVLNKNYPIRSRAEYRQVKYYCNCCNREYPRNNKSHHEKTKKHIKNLNSISI